MPLCVILFVPGRGEKNQFDAFLCDTFCSQRRLLPDTEKKNWCFFSSRAHEEKSFAALVCGHFFPRPERRKTYWCSCVWSLLFPDRREGTFWCSCVWYSLFPDAEKTKLMLLNVILFVPRRERRKTFWCSWVWSFLFLDRREEKSFDALVCDPFCSQTRRFFLGCSCVWSFLLPTGER